MDGKTKQAIMLGIVAGCWAIMLSMYLTDRSYLISLLAGVVVGAIGFGARVALR